MYFSEHNRKQIGEALVIAEEMTSDFFKLTHAHWLRARYDILTLKELRREEVSPHALALLAKYRGRPQERCLTSAAFDFYRICLQDHNILRALGDDRRLAPLPLFCYILTHELVHVVRFSQFQASFEASEEERLAEEREVHRIAQKILAPLSFLDVAPAVRYCEQHWQGGW